MRKDVNEKLMIVFVILLFLTWFMVVVFHLYARCRGRHVGASTASGSTQLRHVVRSAAVCSRGLDPSVVSALPTFVYDSKTEEPPLECAVCLSEFEGGETGRVMPDCNHCFHTGCIDMWLMSHRDCPMCRTRVKAMGDPVEEGSVSISIPGPPPGWRSGLHVFLLSA